MTRHKCNYSDKRLLAVELDDELLVDRQVDVCARRKSENLTGEIVAADVQPSDGALTAGEVLGLLQDGHRTRAFADLDLIPDLALERRDVDLAAVDLDVAMADELTGLAARHGEAEAVADVVQTGLKLLQQELAGDAGLARGLLVILAELALEGEIDTLCLLLLTKLQAVAYDLFDLAGLPVLAWGEVALFNGALVGEA